MQTFDPKKDLKEFETQLRAAVAGLTKPADRAKQTRIAN